MCKTTQTLTSIVLTAAGLLHLLRLIYARDLTIGGRTVPMWVSIVAVLVAGYLAIYSWKQCVSCEMKK